MEHNSEKQEEKCPGKKCNIEKGSLLLLRYEIILLLPWKFLYWFTKNAKCCEIKP
jgi:hypothetical protein